MSLETGTFVSDLDATNPTATDFRSQGDDHLRLIKTLLKATFPTASKAFYHPTSVAKSANFSAVLADMNTTFVITTSGGAVTATLPTLASGDAGWECSFLKIGTDTNPYFIAPPSGTIQSGEVAALTKTRRCIPGHRTKVLWTGSAWVAERVVRTPVGSILDFAADSLPVGYEYANGQTLASASTNYPDFYSVNGSSGVITDRCGRVAAGQDDMGGISSKNRLTGLTNGVNADTFGAAGGLESTTLLTANLPAYTPAGTIGGTQTINVVKQRQNGQPGGASLVDAAAPEDVVISGSNFAFTGTPQGGVSTAINNVQPTIITNFLVVVE